jgi:hypothetical protein
MKFGDASRQDAKDAKFGAKSNNLFFAAFASLRGKYFPPCPPANNAEGILAPSR